MRSDKNIITARYHHITAAALVSAALVVAMFGITLATGWGQESFQQVAAVDVFGERLLAAAAPLRAILTLDAAFIAAYTVLFALMYAAWRDRAPIVARIGLALILSTVALDVVENQMMLLTVDGAPLTADGIATQVFVSQVKFHASYLGLVMFGVLLPHDTFVERALKVSLLFVQLPVGAMVFTVGAPSLVVARTLFFLVGLSTIAWIAHSRSQSFAGSAVGAGDPLSRRATSTAGT